MRALIVRPVAIGMLTGVTFFIAGSLMSGALAVGASTSHSAHSTCSSPPKNATLTAAFSGPRSSSTSASPSGSASSSSKSSPSASKSASSSASDGQRDEFDVPLAVPELVQQVAVAVALAELDQISAAP